VRCKNCSELWLSLPHRCIVHYPAAQALRLHAEFRRSTARIRYCLAVLGVTAVSAHVISDYVIRTARAVLSTAARNAQRCGSVTYSTLLASLLYEELKKELRDMQADEVDKRNILTRAIDHCRQTTNSSREDAVEILRTVLELLETGVRHHDRMTPQERRGQWRVIEGGIFARKPSIRHPNRSQEWSVDPLRF
jgi:hypothetical protein